MYANTVWYSNLKAQNLSLFCSALSPYKRIHLRTARNLVRIWYLRIVQYLQNYSHWLLYLRETLQKHCFWLREADWWGNIADIKIFFLEIWFLYSVTVQYSNLTGLEIPQFDLAGSICRGIWSQFCCRYCRNMTWLVTEPWTNILATVWCGAYAPHKKSHLDEIPL